MKSSASAAGTYSVIATNSASRILIIMMNSASSGSGVHVSGESEESKKECGAGDRAFGERRQTAFRRLREMQTAEAKNKERNRGRRLREFQLQ
jgi:hypothetical protein